MIFVSVGTFIKGFDELIVAVDNVCAEQGINGFAQIGSSSVVPKYMAYSRFLSANEMRQRMRESALIVCHGGFGILGDAMRAQKPIIAVPRHALPNASDSPCNDQRAISQRLSIIYGIKVCLDMQSLPMLITSTLKNTASFQTYSLRCNIPNLILGFLCEKL